MPPMTTSRRPSLAPYIEEPLPDADPADGGFVLIRPPHRVEAMSRLSLRFVSAGLLVIGVLMMVAAARLTGSDVAIAVLLGLVLFAGAGLAMWWMRYSGGVHRIEVHPTRIVLHRAGFGGVEREIATDRAAIEGLRADPLGDGRTALWRVWLELPGGRLELATLARVGDDRRALAHLAERLGVPLRG